MKKIFCIYLVLFVFNVFANDVEVLSGREYFPRVLDVINGAQKSIVGSFYYVSYSEKGNVQQLMKALASSVKRGVEVSFVLDKGYEHFGTSNLSRKNAKAFSFMKKHGIQVFYDDIETLNHSKYLIIDAKISIIGSFNWSNKAFSSNRETAALVNNENTARDLLEEWNKIPKNLPENVENAIPLPQEFFSDKSLAVYMAKHKNDTMIDFYLLCQKLSFERKSRDLEIEEELINEYFLKGKDYKYGRSSKIGYFVKSFLNKPGNKYNFIKEYKNDYKNKRLLVKLNKINKPEFDAIWLSEIYWKDRWFDRLKSRSKFCLLYALRITDSTRNGRYFVKKQDDMVNETGVSKKILSYGFTELQMYNLVEKEINFELDRSTPNGYIVNNFYYMHDFEKDLAKLKKETDPKLFEISYEFCKLLYENYDIDSMKKVIESGREYGVQVIEDTIDMIKGQENAIGKYHRYQYALGIIKNKGKAKLRVSGERIK